MIVQRRQGQLRDQVQSIRDTDRIRDDVVVGAGEQRVPRFWAGIGIDRGATKWSTQIRGHIQREQCCECPSEAMPANRERSHRILPRQRRQGLYDFRGASFWTRDHGFVHIRETVFRVSSTPEEGTRHRQELGILNPFLDSFGTANGNDNVASADGLQNETYRNGVLNPERIYVRREVVGVNCRDDLVGRATSDESRAEDLPVLFVKLLGGTLYAAFTS